MAELICRLYMGSLLDVFNAIIYTTIKCLTESQWSTVNEGCLCEINASQLQYEYHYNLRYATLFV